jgi:hypothetical protein
MLRGLLFGGALMNKLEFNKAFELAKQGAGSFDNLDLFNGFGFRDFTPVCCTLEAMAGLMKWQALQLNGAWDMEALNTIWDSKRKFIIADKV